MGELSTLPNIAPKLEQQLEEVGIHTIRELWEVGSRGAWLRLHKRGSAAGYKHLCALEGAVRGIRQTDLHERVKAELSVFYSLHKVI